MQLACKIELKQYVRKISASSASWMILWLLPKHQALKFHCKALDMEYLQCSIIATVKTDLIAKCYKTDNCEKAIEYVLLNMQCIHDVYFYTQYSQQQSMELWFCTIMDCNMSFTLQLYSVNTLLKSANIAYNSLWISRTALFRRSRIDNAAIINCMLHFILLYMLQKYSVNNTF